MEGPRVQGHLQLHSEFKVSPTQNPDLKGKIKKKKKTLVKAGDKAQQLNYVLYKAKNPSLDALHLCEKPGMLALSCTTSAD